MEDETSSGNAKREKPAYTVVTKRRLTRNAKHRQIIESDEESDCGKDRISILPVDVHFEIASYLSAQDLLHLCRASHGLRAIFLSNSSRHVWRICLSNSDSNAPPCPDDLNEPSYASLLFEKHCQSCGLLRDIHTHEELRIRLCGNCFNAKVERGKTIAEEFDMAIAAHPEVYTLVTHFNEPETREVILNYGSDSDDREPQQIVHSTQLHNKKFFKDDFRKALKGFQDAQILGSNAQSAYVEEMLIRKEAVLKHCNLIYEWRRDKREKAFMDGIMKVLRKG